MRPSHRETSSTRARGLTRDIRSLALEAALGDDDSDKWLAAYYLAEVSQEIRFLGRQHSGAPLSGAFLTEAPLS
jgi:hypothetical protein